MGGEKPAKPLVHQCFQMLFTMPVAQVLLSNAKLLWSAEEADEEVRIASVHSGSRTLVVQHGDLSVDPTDLMNSGFGLA